ncbi:MAG: DJ-1/PfpI family protein [Proteobacteria bacterium]|nr:DJ-1/PfpI family protein [Pseudomonadota bacterium]
MHNVLIPLAQGCEELEAVTIIDILRRAEINVVTAGLDKQAVTASRGTVIVPDTDLDTALQDDYDMVVLPGGRSRTSLCFTAPVHPCTMDFVLTLIESLEGKEKRDEVERGLVR